MYQSITGFCILNEQVYASAYYNSWWTFQWVLLLINTCVCLLFQQNLIFNIHAAWINQYICILHMSLLMMLWQSAVYMSETYRKRGHLTIVLALHRGGWPYFLSEFKDVEVVNPYWCFYVTFRIQYSSGMTWMNKFAWCIQELIHDDVAIVLYMTETYIKQGLLTFVLALLRGGWPSFLSKLKM